MKKNEKSVWGPDGFESPKPIPTYEENLSKEKPKPKNDKLNRYDIATRILFFGGFLFIMIFLYRFDNHIDGDGPCSSFWTSVTEECETHQTQNVFLWYGGWVAIGASMFTIFLGYIKRQEEVSRNK